MLHQKTEFYGQITSELLKVPQVFGLAALNREFTMALCASGRQHGLWTCPDCPDPGAVCTRWQPFMRNGLTLVCGSEGYVVFLNCFKKKQWHILSSDTLIYSDFFPLLDFLTPSSNYFRQVTTFPPAYLGGGMFVLPPQVRSRWRFFVHIPHSSATKGACYSLAILFAKGSVLIKMW